MDSVVCCDDITVEQKQCVGRWNNVTLLNRCDPCDRRCCNNLTGVRTAETQTSNITRLQQHKCPTNTHDILKSLSSIAQYTESCAVTVLAEAAPAGETGSGVSQASAIDELSVRKPTSGHSAFNGPLISTHIIHIMSIQ